MQELGTSRSPELEAMRRWAASPPAWLTVQGPRELAPSIQLGTGGGTDTKTIVNVPCSGLALVPAGSRTKTTVPVP